MTAPADVTAALQSKFPLATLRPSGDHPALNLPIAEVFDVGAGKIVASRVYHG